MKKRRFYGIKSFLFFVIVLTCAFTFAACGLFNAPSDSGSDITVPSDNQITDPDLKPDKPTVPERPDDISGNQGEEVPPKENPKEEEPPEPEKPDDGEDMEKYYDTIYKRVDKNGKEDKYGKYILFGFYPQTLKSDKVTVDSSPDEDGCFLGSDGYKYVKIVANPYDNRYCFNDGTLIVNATEYYFKVELIRWKILNENNGRANLICDSIIAAEKFSDTEEVRLIGGRKVYANNYEYSAARKFLNEQFYNSAFNEVQKKLINTTEVINDALSAGYDISKYECNDTFDKVLLPSYCDIFRDNGKTDADRQRKTSDFTRAQGVWNMTTDWYRETLKDKFDENAEYDTGYGFWLLRSAVDFSEEFVHCVQPTGENECAYVTATVNGVVPEINIRLATNV